MIHVILDRDFPSWLAWASTYLAHAAVWLALGWLCARPRFRLGARAQNAVWRAALVAPLLSASLHASGITPAQLATWQLTMSAAPPADRIPAATTSTRLAPLGPNMPAVIVPALPGPMAGQRAGLVVDAEDPAPLARLGRTPASPEVVIAPARWAQPALPPLPPLPSPPTVVLGFIVAVALVRLLRLALAARRLARELGNRRPVFDPRVHQLLHQLVGRARLPGRIRLTESDTAVCPMALGAREICLPARSATALDDRALRALLAHELAHLERRDNLWLLLGAIIEATLWAPPIARWVRRHMQDSAELAADDRAVALTEDPLGLARSLAEVAAWNLEDGAPDLAHAMASPARGLIARVERLVASDERPASTPWLGRVTGGALLLLVMVSAPGVRSASAGSAGAEMAPPAPVAVAPALVSSIPIAVAPAVALAIPVAVAPAVVPLTTRIAAAPAATVPNDKPGAPRLPARPPAVLPTAPAPAPDAEGYTRRGYGRALPPRPPRPTRQPRFPIPPIPRGAIHQMVQRALAESHLAMNLASARQEADRLRSSGAGQTERQFAEAKLAELERLHGNAQRERARHQGEFEREMETWGKEMSQRSEEYGREMQSWAAAFGADQARNQEERFRYQEESARRSEEQIRRNEEQIRRNEERLKRDAERLRREAARLELEAERLSEAAAEAAAPARPTPARPAAPAAPAAPKRRPPAISSPAPAAAPALPATPMPAPATAPKLTPP